MKALFLILLLSTLAACGGSSGSSPATLDITLGEGIRGNESEPAITDVTAEGGATVVINSRLLGDINSETSVDFNYTPTEDTLVALVLTGTAQDLDISVSSTELAKFSLGDNANEAIVFNAVANHEYVISMVSWFDSGSYELKIAEGNRASLGLANDEYYVELLLTGSETCNGETFQAEGYIDSILNFAQGYVLDTNGLDKVEFDRASGNTLIKDISYNENGEEGQGETRISISEDDGLVSGTSVGSYRYSFSGETVSCSYNHLYTGGILL